MSKPLNYSEIPRTAYYRLLQRKLNIIHRPFLSLAKQAKRDSKPNKGRNSKISHFATLYQTPSMMLLNDAEKIDTIVVLKEVIQVLKISTPNSLE